LNLIDGKEGRVKLRFTETLSCADINLARILRWARRRAGRWARRWANRGAIAHSIFKTPFEIETAV
jgi:hypothetical protein